MSFDVTIAGAAIPTDAEALKSFEKDLNLVFDLDSTLSSLLDATLADVPAGKAKTTVSYKAPAASWNPGRGPVKFGLQAGFGGTLQVLTGGDVVSYTDGLESPKKKSVPVPGGTAYMSLTLRFNISANAAGSYSSGAYGVKAALNTADTYAVTFCKAFPPATNVRAAIAQTFESFVLPLNQDTLSFLKDNDYLLHEFDGNLHLSFGAYAGLSKVLYAGRGSADVIRALGSPLAKVSAGAKPSIKLGVNLDFAFQYATTYEALLSKSGGSAKLHLYRSADAKTSTTLSAGLTFDANLSTKIGVNTKTLEDSLMKAAGGAGSPGGNALSQILQKADATAEIAKYVNEVNSKLASWLNRANGIQVNLQAAIESNKTRTILAGYEIDLTSPNATAAWNAAIAGDFVAAFDTGAITLDVGSGLEDSYQSKTSFSCNLFNLWKANTWSEFSSTYSLVYAGNNVFHFAARVELSQQTQSMGAMRSIDMYFSASADVKTGGASSNAAIDLHVDLTAQADPDAAAKIATMLSAMGAGPAADTLARNLRVFAGSSRKGTAQLQVTIPSSAYGNLQCDPYSSGKPASASNANDQANWNAFAQAADDLNAWPLKQLTNSGAFLETFAAWEKLNCTQNGSATPNRLAFGNPVGWPDGFPALDELDRFGASYSMRAGQRFMDFCADLVAMKAATDVNATAVTWEDLLKLVTDAVKNDQGVDFIRPAALAITRLCKSPISSISGPSDAATPVDHFAVTMTL